MMAEFIAEVGRNHNTYVSVNPRKHRMTGSRRGDAEDINAVIDFPKTQAGVRDIVIPIQ